MKKRRLTAVVAAAMLLAGSVAGWRLTHPTLKDVFRRLDVSQVESAAVYRSHFAPALEPEAVLCESDTERVVGLLRQVRLSGEPTQDYVNWQGVHTGPWFRVKLKSGMELDFAACPPFFFIILRISATSPTSAGRIRQ